MDIFDQFIYCNGIPLIFYLTNDKLYKHVENEISVKLSLMLNKLCIFNIDKSCIIRSCQTICELCSWCIFVRKIVPENCGNE